MILQSENIGDLKNWYFNIFSDNLKINLDYDQDEEKDRDENDDEEEDDDETDLEENFFWKQTSMIESTYLYK